MKHATNIRGHSSLKALAEDIGNLRYDALCQFLSHLARKLSKDSSADMARKRTLLALNLLMASGAADKASRAIAEAWRISEPFMEIDKCISKSTAKSAKKKSGSRGK